MAARDWTTHWFNRSSETSLAHVELSADGSAMRPLRSDFVLTDGYVDQTAPSVTAPLAADLAADLAALTRALVGLAADPVVLPLLAANPALAVPLESDDQVLEGLEHLQGLEAVIDEPVARLGRRAADVPVDFLDPEAAPTAAGRHAAPRLEEPELEPELELAWESAVDLEWPPAPAWEPEVAPEPVSWSFAALIEEATAERDVEQEQDPEPTPDLTPGFTVDLTPEPSPEPAFDVDLFASWAPLPAVEPLVAAAATVPASAPPEVATPTLANDEHDEDDEEEPERKSSAALIRDLSFLD